MGFETANQIFEFHIFEFKNTKTFIVSNLG